jgi:Ssp1 endopeptidase immunity protein Rap1a
MSPLMSTLLLALALNVSTARAQDIGSAQAMLPHCMAALKPDTQSSTGGRCMGIIATLSFVSRVLPDNLKFCHPNTATPEQILQAISNFMDANPDAIDRDFRLIALAAMRNKWPCQE